LRVFSDKPRRLVYQSSLPAGSGKGTLEWNGTNQQGQPVAPGLYYISVTDSDGTSNDEMWIR
jgi:flagellar hook assembly protein FlgD